MTDGQRSGAPLDLGFLGFEGGAHLLLRRALSTVEAGGRITVTGGDPALGVHLRAWARREGHGFATVGELTATWELVRGSADTDRWAGAERAGGPRPDGIVAHPPAHWGLAARGALVEAGGPDGRFDLDDRDVVWADLAPRLYAHAAAAQWDPATAVDWDPVTARITHLARVDEARHVAFGVAHLEHQGSIDPTLRGKLRGAIERRHDALADTAGGGGHG
ncbi:MAG: hypothetical protein L0I76_02135 [Pseudonocardia sp.]|nr:hypothetical protein [Pseudonocardia sp.]